MPTSVRIATRGSVLALRQAELVADRLRQVRPDLAIELVVASTQGDRDKSTPLTTLGQGVFVRGVEEMLRDGLADLAVHSLKDVPPALTPGLDLVAFPTRADPRDALIAVGRYSEQIRDGGTAALPPGARLGTGSPRRAAQLRAIRPDLEIRPIRGNLDTRIRKLRGGEFDAITVAVAGVERLGRGDELDWIFSPEECTPAAGQGTLVVQAKSTDRAMAELVDLVNDADLEAESIAERAFLAALGGGCQLPAGALACRERGRLSLIGVVASPDGQGLVRGRAEDSGGNADSIARNLAGRLLREAEGALVRSER